MSTAVFKRRGRTINKPNCVTVRFTFYKTIFYNSAHVETTILRWSPRVSYLGMHMDQRVTWRRRVDVTKIKFLRARNALGPLPLPQSPLGVRSKTLIYTIMLPPIFLHGVVIWLTAPDSYLKEIFIL